MELNLEIEGMSCMHCARTVQSALESVPGVERADVSWERGKAVVEGSEVSKDRLVEAVAETEAYHIVSE
jgi:copper chaperone